MKPEHRVVVGITGASGSIYGRRLIQALLALDPPLEVHVAASTPGKITWQYELGGAFGPVEIAGSAEAAKRLHVYAPDDLFCPLGSGSFRHRGMVVAPCSARSLGAIAAGLADGAVTRAADVCLKERRPLILMMRETPLSRIHIENMLRVTDAGGVMLPASPGFYHRPTTVDELVDFMVARALDHLGLEHAVGTRWKEGH